MAEQRVARVGDSCTLSCSVHGNVTGTFFEGSSVADIDGVPIVLVGHRGTASCGHVFRASTGSTRGTVLGIAVVRVTDTVVFTTVGGSGTVTTGSAKIKWE